MKDSFWPQIKKQRCACFHRSLSVWVIWLIALAALPAGAEDPEDRREDLVRLEQQNQVLQRRVDLASGDRFYLLLDPAALRLVLMLKGAVLQDYHVLALEVAAPRVFFRSRRLPEDWQGRIWTGGTLDPSRERERTVLAPVPFDPEAPDSILPAPTIPPTPEEAYPVPHRYHVTYEGGLSLEVRLPAGADSTGQGSKFWERGRAWWQDLWAALRPAASDAIRLRIILDQEDAKSLYRALPPETDLLIIPPHASMPASPARKEAQLNH